MDEELNINSVSNTQGETGVSKENPPVKGIKLPLAALLLSSAVPALSALICFVTMWSVYVSLFFLFITVISPIVGVTLGVVCLCEKGKVDKKRRILSIIAVAVPVAFVLIMILLFSTGVARISFM